MFIWVKVIRKTACGVTQINNIKLCVKLLLVICRYNNYQNFYFEIKLSTND